MPRRIVKFNLELNKSNQTSRFQCKDYEDIQLNIKILQDGEPLDLTGCTFELGNTLGIKEIISKEDNILKVLFNTQGNFNKVAAAEISIIDDEGVLKTPSFFFTVIGPSLVK